MALAVALLPSGALVTLLFNGNSSTYICDTSTSSFLGNNVFFRTVLATLIISSISSLPPFREAALPLTMLKRGLVDTTHVQLLTLVSISARICSLNLALLRPCPSRFKQPCN